MADTALLAVRHWRDPRRRIAVHARESEVPRLAFLASIVLTRRQMAHRHGQGRRGDAGPRRSAR